MASLQVTKSTIRKYIRKVEDARSQKYGLLRWLKKNGRITFNNGSYEQQWRVTYRRNQMTQMGDGDVMSFPKFNRHEVANISYRSQSMNESVSKMEQLQNRGKEAIVKLVEDRIDNMLDDAYCDLDKQLYLDGDEAGREQYLQGFLTVVGKAVTPTAKYPVPATTDDYAGLVTAPGHYGGTVTGGTYPDGVVDPEYIFWTPFQSNWGHADFGNGTWADACSDALRATLDYMAGTRGSEDRPDTVWMPTKLFSEFKQKHDTIQRFEVTKNQELVKLGFRAINFEGTDLVDDHHVPAGQVFGFRAEHVELMSMQSELLVPLDDVSIEDRTKRFGVDFFGNTKFKQTRSLLHMKDYG